MVPYWLPQVQWDVIERFSKTEFCGFKIRGYYGISRADRRWGVWLKSDKLGGFCSGPAEE